MKKTFRSILAGAVALLAVSCYDDAALRSEIDKLDDRITVLENTLSNDVSGINSLASRLSDAENAIKDLNEDLGSVEGDIADLGSLATDLAALKTQVNDLVGRLDAADGKVDGIVKDLKEAVDALIEADKNFALKADVAGALAKIAVVNVTEVNGNVVLTLADGNTVELSKPLKNVENTGLVTVIQDGAEKYWAVKDADGKVTSLGVPVGHPDVDIEFSVASNGDLQYSVNGGELIDAGVNTNDLASCLVADVVETEDCVIITIGEVEYTLPKYVVDESSFVIKAGKTAFGYGDTKEFELNMNDINKFYVMTKPDGWKAVLDGKTLVVTAPSEEAVKLFAEAEGEILLHANTTDGKCKIAKLAVTTTIDLSISIDEKSGVVDVTSALLMSGERYDPLTGGMITYHSFSQIAIGMASIELFEKDPEGYVAASNAWELPYDEIGMIGYLDNIYSNLYDGYFEYEEGVCEVAEYHNMLVADLYMNARYEEMPKDAQFIIWAAPVDNETWEPDPSQVVYAYYAPVIGSIESVGEPSFNDVDVNISLYGADAYYVGKVAAQYAMDNMTGETSIESYIMNNISAFEWGMNYLGALIEESGEYKYKLSEILCDGEEAQPLAPNTLYYAYVVPVKEGKPWSEYKYDKDIAPYVHEFTTAALQPGGEGTVEIAQGESTYTRLSAEITASEGTSQVYYYFYEPAMIDELGEKLIDDLIKYGYAFSGKESVVFEPVGAPGTVKALVACAVDANGKYGELNVCSVQSKTISFSSTFKVAVGNPTFEPNGTSSYKVSIPVTVEGGEAVKYYYYWSNRVRTEEEINSKLPLGEYPYNSAPQLPATYTFYTSVAQYQFAVMAESATGELSEPVIVTYNKPE